MIVYDKAVWHIDEGEQEKTVVARFRVVFEFLRDKKMLNEEGLEALEYAMDSSASINSSILNDEGNRFIRKYYDSIDFSIIGEIKKQLQLKYYEFETYDKAAWHIDRGEKESIVVSRFKEILEFLRDEKMLSDEGMEVLAYAVDNSVSLTRRMVNDKGKDFLDLFYESFINKKAKNMQIDLRHFYNDFVKKHVKKDS